MTWLASCEFSPTLLVIESDLLFERDRIKSRCPRQVETG